MVTDCDETFNYWEPLHFLLFGSGFQTWEYSPVYALRSYAYLFPLRWLGQVLWPRWLHHPAGRARLFFMLRGALGLACAAAETTLFAAECSESSGDQEAAYLYVAFSAMSPGMFHAGSSLLPSACAMVCVTVAYAAWMRRHPRLAVWGIAVAALFGWPFAALLGVSIAMRYCWTRGMVDFVRTSALSAVAILAPMVAVDSRLYGRLVVAPLNLLRYNVFSPPGRGPDIFGTEPWYFYLLNTTLNFPLIFQLAVAYVLAAALEAYGPRRSAASAPVDERVCTARRRACLLLPVVLWFGTLSRQPHKEERFLHPTYPLICLGAAYLVTTATARLARGRVLRIAAYGAVVAVCATACTSRIASQVQYYSAPLELFHWLARQNATAVDGAVCIGKEWYRYPSSFFLPAESRLLFVRTDFDGLMPKPFTDTRSVPSGMNDANRQVVDERYAADISSDCAYFVDFVPAGGLEGDEPTTDLLKRWRVARELPFLDQRQTPRLHRAFYVPGPLGRRHRSYGRYVVLQRPEP
ncbi:hypothetical protein CDCA_CDCA10G2876 [Cyanidium caldarium]|uniref:Mannosyltransferase n=1 Tax=Cyanidium caldarium TaxID=2771 RepID=A0AAV9IXK1_CYACA|nr:hypothetical protein CDCA_CDCA10G2876 [Cyanidium caldarium]